MKQLLIILFLLSCTLSFSQSQISNEQSSVGFSELQYKNLRHHTVEIEGIDFLLIWTFDYILKVNLDDSTADIELIDHKSECTTRSHFFVDKILSASESDIYEIDASTGAHTFHLEMDQPDIWRAEKVGDHLLISGFRYNALYQSDLDELIELPHTNEYKVIGDDIFGVFNGGVFLEYDSLSHVDLNDGTLVVDFNLVNIRNHTLFRGDEDPDKIYFSTVEAKLYAMSLDDYSIELICSDFPYFDRDLYYKDGRLYIAEEIGFDLITYNYDLNLCQKDQKIGSFVLDFTEYLTDIHSHSNGNSHIIETNHAAYVYNASDTSDFSVQMNEGILDVLYIQNDEFLTVSSFPALNQIVISTFMSDGSPISENIIIGHVLIPFDTEDEFGAIYTKDNKLFKIIFNEDNTHDNIEIARNGFDGGPYEHSNWSYRAGCFYSMIDDQFHYKNKDGQIKKLDDLTWQGMVWVDEGDMLFGITSKETGQDLIHYDLENQEIINSFSIDINEHLRGVIKVKDQYFVVGTHRIYNLDINTGVANQFIQANFLPYLSSNERTLGILFAASAQSLTSFDGESLTELFPSDDDLRIEPVNQYEGSYMIYKVNELTWFNTITDELITLEKNLFFYELDELRYEGENCLIDINNNWYFYYSSDTLVVKPLLVESEHQLVWGYVANHTMFTSSSPFDRLSGIPFAQTENDEVIELESLLGSVSICDAIYLEDKYYLLSFDEYDIFLHSLSSELDEAEELAVIPRPICSFDGDFYFLGPDIEGDINFRISDVNRGTVYYQYEHSEEDISLLFDPSSKIGNDIGDLKFYDDEGFYFTATDHGENYQMWMIANDQNPNSTDDVEEVDTGSLAYPNPFNNEIYFKSPVWNVTIYDILGNALYHSKSSSSRIGIDHLDEILDGVYFIEYFDGKHKFVEKVVKVSTSE